MKKILKYIVLGLFPLMFASCFNEAIIEESQNGNAGIVLDLSSVLNTKALETTSVDYEAYVNHVDVFIFGTQKNKEGDDVNLHYERLQFDVTGEGSKMLDVKKAWFTENASYDVYVIANSTITEDKFKEDVKEVSDIWELTQEDLNLHLTGLDIDDVPDFFLMEGRGYTDEGKTKAVLNDGNAATNVEVKAELSRAAAKIVVELTAGAEVKYLAADNESVYYYRNLPYNTVVVEASEIGYEISPKLNTSVPSPVNGRVTWTVASDETNGKVVITGYAYAYSWTELDKETSLIVNIPMLYDENGDKVFDASENSSEIHAVNYYKIPLSKDKKFDRNHVYKVAATVNAPGSSTGFDPIEIKELKYDAYSWTKIWPDINVGGETNKPKYLQLNKYEMEMNNIATDFETLEFSSSSAITSITLVTEAAAGLESMTNTASTSQTGYYVNKFGQPTAISSQIRNQINNGTSWGTTSDNGTSWNKTAINGNIKVYSPIPTNNAPRYLVYKVTNADNMVAYFTVVQYPLEYITNIQAWYSYREDFGTTYETKGSNRYVAADDYNTQTGEWEYIAGSRNFSGSNYFFASRVATEHTSGNNKGMSDMDYYYWSQNGNSVTNVDFANPRNARLYHVVITSSSSKYKIGRPKMTNGVTDSGDDNKTLVSPSFMLASQLGATRVCANVQKAAAHCEQYVEVYRDKVTGESVHLNDWRLPTEAEIKVIINFQYVADAAVDEVLAGRSYYSASGLVENPDYTIGNTYQAIRCVRDVY